MSILRDQFNIKSNVSSLKTQPPIIQTMFKQIVKLQAESLVTTEMLTSHLAESSGVVKQEVYDKIEKRSQELLSELMAFYQGE